MLAQCVETRAPYIHFIQNCTKAWSSMSAPAIFSHFWILEMSSLKKGESTFLQKSKKRKSAKCVSVRVIKVPWSGIFLNTVTDAGPWPGQEREQCSNHSRHMGWPSSWRKTLSSLQFPPSVRNQKYGIWRYYEGDPRMPFLFATFLSRGNEK